MQDDKHNRIIGIWLMSGGIVLMVVALLLTGYNLWDEWQAGEMASQVLEQMSIFAETDRKDSSESDENEIPDYIINPNIVMPAIEVYGDEYIEILEIPVLRLTLPVIKEWSYASLRTAPCRYAGSVYQNGFVIAGHNYSCHFGQLSNLSPGDSVIYSDVDGNVFAYEVAEVQVLASAAVEDMISDEWALSLFTCTLDGRARVTVRCEKLDNSSLLLMKQDIGKAQK